MDPMYRDLVARVWMVMLIFLIIIPFEKATSQYIPRSPYLINPNAAIPYVDSCARFWFRVYDPTYGGFYQNVDRVGNWQGTDKALVSQTRDAYGFARAFMLTGSDTFLVMSRRALQFMYQHAWDTTHGGWFTFLNRFGTPTNPTDEKSTFVQHYALLGISANYEATRDTTDWRWLMRGYNSNEQFLWDARPQFTGYYESATYNFSSRFNKGIQATIDAVNTFVMSLYLMTGESAYATRLRQLAANLVERYVPTLDSNAIGFVERFDSDWNWNNSPGFNRQVSMGHVLKSAWVLSQIHHVLPDTNYVIAAEKLAENVLTRGYDSVYGGPYKDYDRLTGAMLSDSAKAWWQLEQGITAGLILYELTGKPKYLKLADESLDFYMKHFVDRVYGEVYFDRTRRGDFYATDAKGAPWKAAYHSVELGYFLYLYGNLFYHQRPVTLHYKFVADTVDRELPMNPIAYATLKYRIREVRREGVLYSNFDAASRRLRLPRNVGGKFAVTYERVPGNPTSVGENAPREFALYQNYPNPFNPITAIRFTVPSVGRGHTPSLQVFDMLGRSVATLVSGEVSEGENEVVFDASALSSGVYFYRLRVGDFVATRRMVLLR